MKWITNLLSHKNLHIEKNAVDSFFENNTVQIGLRVLLNNSTEVNKIKNNFYKKTYKTWKKYDIKYIPKNINSIKKTGFTITYV